MIKIRQIDKVRGLEGAIYGMRLAMLSGDKSDSVFYDQWSGEYHDIMGNFGPYDTDRISEEWDIGLDDLSLMRRLGKSGSEHAKYRRAIVTWVDVTAPLYWWKEADTYKVGTVRLSSSTMHKIHAKEFTPTDFSHGHLFSSTDASTESDHLISYLAVIFDYNKEALSHIYSKNLANTHDLVFDCDFSMWIS